MTNAAPVPAAPSHVWKRLGLLSLVVAGTTASILGCQVDEGSVYPFIVDSVDIGGTLNTGAVMAWFMLVTWPGMLVSLALWAVVVARWISRRMRG